MSARKGVARDTFFKEPASALIGKIDSTNRDREVEREIDSVSNISAVRSIPSTTSKEADGSYVGYANLPNQVYRKAVKRGFDFNIMVVGESGLGKSTLMNSLFMADIYNSDHPGPSARAKKTNKVETTSLVLSEGGVQLRLTLIDTPGFGNAVNNDLCWQPIMDCVESRYEAYLDGESRVSRTYMLDPRIHCCLYFISPNGHGLKEVDREFMTRLHNRVNIIPVIAKADTMTPEECRDFKKTIINEIAQNNIHIFDFPLSEDEEDARIVNKMKERVPFAVVGSNTTLEVQGRRVRARVYPWGVVEVDNLEHNDFTALRHMLIKTYMQDLKDQTNNVHYENYRYQKLISVTKNAPTSSPSAISSFARNSEKSPMAQIEEEKREHVGKMRKMEAEMEQVFEMKVKEKLQKLKDSENDLNRRAEQMRKSLENQEKEMVERRRSFEMEKEVWEDQNKGVMEDQNKKERKKLF